ncbi:xylulokinase [Sanguibacter sp. HDW7]|uniref:xylulokinase n=1 Tax=Sanguibacter sp. HDW7 TaxID=2714931 RepID=UPI0014090EE0|nr:FGGY family carbohydrate kinase [Sanguibacter sp. HDW7]QIK84382.1 xylulose kinase [Sanguibacter sp. HDW7]
MTLVAGVDSSTQSCKIVIRDAATGALVREGRASHPAGTTVDPDAWWDALVAAAADAGGLDDVAAIAVGGQQHGMVVLDADGRVIRDAMLWNDTSSAPDAADLVRELGDGDTARGAAAWAEAVGAVPVASFTGTKLRWLARVEPENAARVAAVCLPHDWLTWRLRGARSLEDLTTDRSDASGTCYWSPTTGEYRHDLLALALGRDDVVLPRVLSPGASAGTTDCELTRGAVVGVGAGDNAGAALGLGLRAGDVSVSIGTSGVVAAVTDTPAADASGLVAGFADATGRFLPLVATLNASRILDSACSVLGVDYDRLAELALAAPAGADGVVLVPYFEGERTPNLPDASASLHGLTLANANPGNIARAFVEGLLGALADGLDQIVRQGTTPERVVLVGGGAQSPAVRAIAPVVLGVDVLVPPAGEYVADGAARQAAWALSGADDAPVWEALSGAGELLRADTSAEGRATTSRVRARYAEARAHVLDRA